MSLTRFSGNLKLKSLLGLVSLLKPGSVLSEQLQPLYSNSMSALAANATAAAFIAYSLNTPGVALSAEVWALSCLIVNLCSAACFSIAKRSFAEPNQIATASWILTIASGARGLIWGVGFATLLPHSSGHEQIILGWMIAGLMCGGAFSAWSHPAAAIIFTAFTGVGGAFGMAGVPGMADTWMPYITVVLFLLLVRAVFTSVVVLRQSVEAERKIANKNEVIGLLLKDFEESASDWLWETDAQNRLIRGAERFAKVLELPADRVKNYSLVAIAEVYGNTDTENMAFLATLQAKDAFREQVLALGEKGQECFLELSAKPVFAADESFIGWRGVASDVTDERLADMKVRKLALFDTLTELPNSAFFYDRLEYDAWNAGRQPPVG